MSPLAGTSHNAKQKQLDKEIYKKLVELGGGKFTEEKGIQYHDGSAILLPRGMTKAQAAKELSAAATADQETHAFQRTFKFRPWDGAHALQLTMERLYGRSGRGLTVYDMFGGAHPPQKITVETGVDTEAQIPWGQIEIPMFDGVMHTTAHNDPEYGQLFTLVVNAPLKHREAVEGFFKAIQATLETDSIYKGKAFIGTDQPKFIDPFKVNRNHVVYSEEVKAALYDTVWGPIRHAELMRKCGKSLNIKVVLDGDFGTGKTLAGDITGQEAVDKGWTFIQCDTGRDDLQKVMRTAMLYQPAVVFVEDIDKAMEEGQDPTRIAKMLELFDGIQSKGNQVMVLMTSNNAGEMPKGMLRSGRIDELIRIGGLDQEGVERLTKVIVPEYRLDSEVDFTAVYESMNGFAPAFIRRVIDRSETTALVRTGSLDYVLTTQDFVRAADQLRPQHNMHLAATEERRPPELETALNTVVSKSVERHYVDLDEGTGRLFPYEAE